MNPTPTSKGPPRKVMLVGGGRWGREHAGVLARILPGDSEILWVSKYSHPALPAPAAGRSEQILITMFEEMGHAIRHAPDSAIIATAAHTHAETAGITLAHGIPTLVEKPFVMDSRVAAELIKLADDRGLTLCVGLHLFFASYLPYFRSFWRQRPVADVRLTWLDCASEVRYGETKSMDATVPLVHDVFPHLWTIIRVIFPGHEVRISDVECLKLGGALLDLATEDFVIKAQIGRRAPARSRRIDLTFLDGGTASLDFTKEPGTIVIDGSEVADDPEWGRQPSPLSRELASFLAASTSPALAADSPCRAANVLGSVIGAETASGHFVARGAQELARRVFDSPDPVGDPDIQSLLIDNLVPELRLAGLRATGPDEYLMLLSGGLAMLFDGSTVAATDAPLDVRAVIENSGFLRQTATAIKAVKL